MNIGLVLEGGGMRGVFTAGVTDCFLDNKIFFPYVIGVSAGASNGLSYASRQRGRARKCDIEILSERNYIGLRYLITSGCIMDYDFLFDELPKKLMPYDMQAYLKSGRYVMVATSCATGKPVYFDTPRDFDDLLLKCKASCSLPFVCRTVTVEGVPMLDGGISDPLPVERAKEDGYAKRVVVLTRNLGYRKNEKFSRVPPFIYPKFPKLREALSTKNARYNRELAHIEELERAGEIVVIRPKNPLRVNRLERSPKRLDDLYREGYECAESSLATIRALAKRDF